MDDLQSLESVLNGEGSEAQDDVTSNEVQQEVQQETENKQKPVVETETKADDKQDDSPAESQDNKDDESSWTKAAVLDERRKRQELERQLDELKAKPASDGEQKQDERPDLFDDPDGAIGHIERKFEEKLVNQKIELSRSMVKSSHDDYDEMEQVFIDMAKENPALANQMRMAENPALFAYQQGKKHTDFQQMQDIDSYKAKIEAEVREKVLKELESKQAKQSHKAELASGPSLSKARSQADEPVDEPSLEDLVGR